MAMPKKDTRKITVDKIEYRWKVRWRHFKLTSSVELYENPQSVLSINFPFVKETPFFLNSDFVVKPKTIESCIKTALSQGWKPNEKGKTFQLNWKKE
jgi:hypothetical protein